MFIIKCVCLMNSLIQFVRYSIDLIESPALAAAAICLSKNLRTQPLCAATIATRRATSLRRRQRAAKLKIRCRKLECFSERLIAEGGSTTASTTRAIEHGVVVSVSQCVM